MFTVGGKSQASTDVLGGELRVISDDILFAHALSKPVKNVIDSNPHMSNTRLPAALAGFDSDTVSVVHGGHFSRFMSK